MKNLIVYFHGRPAGTLSQDSIGKLSFQYAPEWLGDPIASPLSQSLPLREEAYAEQECTGYFGGLLPEDFNRDLIARNIGITSGNDYAMLKVIGGECAGAVTILDPEQELEVQEHSYHPVSLEELATILDTLPNKPLLAGEAEVRLSLAGAQNKLAIYHDEKGFALPLHESPSTHILKPEIKGFPGLVENEAYCMKLARNAGLPTATADAIQIGPHRCLMVERYDRTGEGTELQRLHQEDFCQAMGIPSRYKYQNEGGPTPEQCFRIIREASSLPAKDLITLFETVIFNYLIGNNDAHGKNFSLLYRPVENRMLVGLTPLYDLVCTTAFIGLSPRMAMKIGSTYNPADLRLRHWEAFWKSIGFSIPQAKRQTLGFLERLNPLLNDPPASDMEERIQGTILARLLTLSRMLSA
ncbi:type II toxin-antitoxin system HipA family toxin [Pontiellaceae bacterium B12227]|nr:type II toxin-antitoxin system HipA family toxin [Pontiellaceae bacterium B12227]